jgi:hypothetical protein
MYAPSRHEAREFIFSAWEKYRAAAPLTALERIAVEIIALHPEYHALLEARDANIDADYSPDRASSTHSCICRCTWGLPSSLQSTARRESWPRSERLTRKHDDRHDALHDALECLGETMWQAQRTGSPPDTEAFLECLRRK